jgi:hypothetical protein
MITDCLDAFSALLLLYPTIDMDLTQHCEICQSENERKMRGISTVKLLDGKLQLQMKQKRVFVEVLDWEAYVAALLDTDDNHVKVKETFVERCDSEKCYSLLELAEILGCVIYQSDDIETKQQYISNTCTGFYRQYQNWRFPIKNESPLWDLFCLKKQCIKCGVVNQNVKKQKPYCAECFQSLLQTKQSKFQQLKIQTGLFERRSQFEFVKSLPNHDPKHNFCSFCSKTENDFKPVFYYGYKAICGQCVFKEVKQKKDGQVLASTST